MILQKRVPEKDGDMYTPKIVDNDLKIAKTKTSIKERVRANDISGT